MGDIPTCGSITLWDSSDDPDASGALILRWNGYTEDGTTRSLLRYVEENAARLRRRYLEWVHDLGQSTIRGKRLVEHLAVDHELSCWWLTLLAEKSFYKSPITDAIRLLALDEIVHAERPRKIRLVSGSAKLDETLRAYCRALKVEYQWQRVPRSAGSVNAAAAAFRCLPHPVRAMVTLLRHLWQRWSLRSAAKRKWFAGERALFICSYFIHLDRDACARGEFVSNQWGRLPELLRKAGYRANWLQHYLESSVVPDTDVALEWASRFTADAERQGIHAFVDSYLSGRVVKRVLAGWLKLMLTSYRLDAIAAAFLPAGSQLSLWPILRDDWFSSLRGSAAINNLVCIKLFDAALAAMPHQRIGLYLAENQAWERALAYAWRKHGHGRLIGVEHSTVRFWDLRNFNDPRTFESPARFRIPRPDLVALNGRAAVETYSFNSREEHVVEAEALRYDYLNDVQTAPMRWRQAGGVIRVLVLTDYIPSATKRMLELLQEAQPLVSRRVKYAVKPHPSCPVDPADYPSLAFAVTTDPLIKLLPDFDIAYSSNMTSASVDAYLAGLPEVVMLDENGLNFSPLRGQPDVRFASSPNELAHELTAAIESDAPFVPRRDFFFLDPQLPRWQRLLDTENRVAPQ